jgi:NAD(P)-dependent dehydrogenase (short-subunit alcohol dehydrogenase family)
VSDDGRPLEGRGAVVTGGGRGIGAAVARRLSAAGAAVVVSARTESEIRRVADELREHDGRARAIRCDVTSPDQVDALAREASDWLAETGLVPDILVNNAGAASSAPITSLSLETWNDLFAVNATSTFLCTRALLKGMMERGWGRVVNVASVAGLSGARYIAAYAAAKHAVLGFTRCAAAEAATHGVTVNAVCPAYVDTPMTEQTIARIADKTGRSREQALESVLAAGPQHRLIEPGEVAHAVLALVAEEARGINGQSIVIDGGGLLS